MTDDLYLLFLYTAHKYNIDTSDEKNWEIIWELINETK